MAETLSHPVSSTERQTRRERVRAFKDAFPHLGIYCVRHTSTGRAWIGASRNVDGMLNRVRFELKMGAHRDASLAREWAASGADSFTFEIIDRVKQRSDPTFDYEAELAAMLSLWQAETRAQLHGGSR